MSDTPGGSGDVGAPGAEPMSIDADDVQREVMELIRRTRRFQTEPRSQGERVARELAAMYGVQLYHELSQDPRYELPEDDREERNRIANRRSAKISRELNKRFVNELTRQLRLKTAEKAELEEQVKSLLNRHGPALQQHELALSGIVMDAAGGERNGLPQQESSASDDAGAAADLTIF